MIMLMTNEVEIVAYVRGYGSQTSEDYGPLREGFFRIILLNNTPQTDVKDGRRRLFVFACYDKTMLRDIENDTVHRVQTYGRKHFSILR